MTRSRSRVCEVGHAGTRGRGGASPSLQRETLERSVDDLLVRVERRFARLRMQPRRRLLQSLDALERRPNTAHRLFV